MSIEYNNPKNMEQRKSVLPPNAEEMNRIATVLSVAFSQKPTLENLAQRLIWDWENLDHMRQNYPKWIDCNDKLPVNEDAVLACFKSGVQSLSCWYSVKNKDWYQYGMPFNVNEYITHWMPIPEKP